MLEMTAPKITNKHLLTLLKTYWQWRLLWVFTTILFGGLGVGYAMFLKEDKWVSSQGLLVRDEANGGVMRLGRFESQTAMKAAQETILEMARNPQVLRNALLKVGREPSKNPLRKLSFASSLFGKPATGAPTSKEVESLAKDGIEVRAPRGAELGTTEVIYLDVSAKTPEHAIKLNRAVTEELEKHLQEVRRVRADGVIAELKTAAESARVALEASTDKLRKLEETAGADLSDLRSLTDANVGGSANRTRLDSVKSELLAVELRLQQLKTEHSVAFESLKSPNKFLSAPAKVLTSNPGLLKLRQGLADASITRSELTGRFTAEHPKVVAAKETEAKIVEQLRSELVVAIGNLEQELEITTERARRLREKQAHLEERLSILAGVRADYANAAAEVRSRNEQLQRADMELASAVASRNAASTSSLVTQLDEPIVGETPVGPGKSTIVAGATACGLMFGLGLVFLFSPMELQPTGGFGRRSSDFAGFGRRMSDQVRVADASAMPAGGERRRRGEDRGATSASSAASPQVADRRKVQAVVASLSDSSGCEDSLSQELLGGLGELSFAEHANTVRPNTSGERAQRADVPAEQRPAEPNIDVAPQPVAKASNQEANTSRNSVVLPPTKDNTASTLSGQA